VKLQMAFEQDPLKQKRVIIIASTATIKISSARLGKIDYFLLQITNSI
jgi:hypothetical protein